MEATPSHSSDPRYGMSVLLRTAEGLDQRGELEHYEGPDAGLLVHLSGFHDRLLAVRHHQIALKRAYDEAEPAYKLPFALKDYDPSVLPWILKNTFSFSLSHGCTGFCTFCCFGALLTSGKNVEHIPLEQAKCFFDTWLGPMGPEERAQALGRHLGTFYMYEDSDPFDYPHIVELMDYVYGKYGDTPHLTTVMPYEPKAREAFDRLTGDAMKYKRLKTLNRLKPFFESIVNKLKDNGYASFAECAASAEADSDIIRTIINAVLAENDDFEDLINWSEKGIAGLDTIYSGPEGISLELERQKLISELAGRADVGRIRVSGPPHRLRLVKKIDTSRQLFFDQSFRTTGEYIEEPIPSGIHFFKSGKGLGGYGIHCLNGFSVTPFGVFNKVGGRISHEYPQGRIIVPFKGFQRDNPLGKKGDDLGGLLTNCIVLRSSNITPNRLFTELLLYDGQKRVRKVHFNGTDYRVISDQVIEEGVENPEDVKASTADFQSHAGETSVRSLVVPFESTIIPSLKNIYTTEAIRLFQYHSSGFTNEAHNEIANEGPLPWLMRKLGLQENPDAFEPYKQEYQRAVNRKFRENFFDSDGKFQYVDFEIGAESRRQAVTDWAENGGRLVLLAKKETPYVQEAINALGTKCDVFFDELPDGLGEEDLMLVFGKDELELAQRHRMQSMVFKFEEELDPSIVTVDARRANELKVIEGLDATYLRARNTFK